MTVPVATRDHLWHSQSILELPAVADKAHWESVYTKKPLKEMSWYRDSLDTSLALIAPLSMGSNAAIIDIGGGASTLVDDLLRLSFQRITVLDISATALEKAKERLGAASERVQWMEGDVRTARLPENYYDLWHDRATFHFLTNQRSRDAYVEAANRSVKLGGFLVIGTFAKDGPTKCSGLPVERYGPEELASQFPAFQMLESRHECHEIPSGMVQSFVYVLLRKCDGRFCPAALWGNGDCQR